MHSASGSSLRLGLYGAGPHSRSVLLPALVGLEHPLEAVCDPRSGLADDLAQRFAFRSSFADLQSLLRDADIQALIISRDTPNLPSIIEPLLSSKLPFWLDAATPGLEKLIGAKGVAATDLRPVGKVKIGTQRIEARAESTMIDAGADVRVVSATGTEVVVREIAPDDKA